jgi:hypothetical protein
MTNRPAYLASLFVVNSYTIFFLTAFALSFFDVSGAMIVGVVLAVFVPAIGFFMSYRCATCGKPPFSPESAVKEGGLASFLWPIRKIDICERCHNDLN